MSGFFAEQQQGQPLWRRRIIIALVLIGIASVASLPILQALDLDKRFGGYSVRLWMLLHVLFAVFGLIMIEAMFRNGDADSRWKVKHLCFGLAAVFGYDFYLFSDAALFQRVDDTLFEGRGYIVALSAPLIAISVARSHIWDTSLRLSRQFAASSLTVAGSGVYLILMAVAGYYIREYSGSWGRVSQADFFLATLILLGVIFSSSAVRARIRVYVSKHFFAYHYDYREEWLNFARALSRDEGQLNLNQRIVRAVADIADCTAGALWILKSEDRAFLPEAAWNFAGPLTNQRLPAEIVDGSLVSFLKKSDWVVDLQEFRAQGEKFEALVLPHWLQDFAKARLILPLYHRDELIAFLILGMPKVPLELNWELLDLLKTVSRQAAGHIAEQQNAAALSDARKMEEFNKRSAFVVHDVKNLVGQLSLMAKNAESHWNKPEFKNDMLETVDNTVQGMNKLLRQFKQQTASPDGHIETQSCAEILHTQARKWRQKTSELELEITADARNIMVNASDFTTILDHLIMNACEAAGPEGRVWLRFELRPREYTIEVKDNGAGMDADFVQNRLFRPFQSSKEDGMGIGAYQVRELVRHCGGRLEVESTPGKGTSMKIYLPRTQFDDVSKLSARG